MKIIEQPEVINEREVKWFYNYNGFILGTLRLYCRVFVSWVLQSIAQISPHPGLTVSLQRLRGVKIGKHVFIGSGVNIDDIYPSMLTIEDYVSIGMRTMIFAHSNPTCSLELKTKYYPRKVAQVIIKKGAWVAPGCIILAGVTIGENSIIGAGSVVTKDVLAYNVVAGIPAKVVSILDAKII
jgi:acetyltransferase-like isoleucine patch superfamily enzyme